MAGSIKVMIVDDHLLIRVAMRTVLAEAGMTVVGECDDGNQEVQPSRGAAPRGDPVHPLAGATITMALGAISKRPAQVNGDVDGEPVFAP